MNSRKLSIKTVYFIENKTFRNFPVKAHFHFNEQSTHSRLQSSEAVDVIFTFILNWFPNHTREFKKKKQRRNDRQTIYQLISAIVLNVDFDWKNDLKRSRETQRVRVRKKNQPRHLVFVRSIPILCVFRCFVSLSSHVTWTIFMHNVSADVFFWLETHEKSKTQQQQ